MANLEKINPKEKLRTSYPKINAAIEAAGRADLNATQALNTANEAKTTADKTQSQLNNIIIDSGTSDAEVIQARGGAPVLNDRLDGFDAQFAGNGVYPESLGAKIDGSSNDTGFIQEAVNSRKKLYGNGISIVTSLDTKYGLMSADTLKIVRQSDGYLFNSYADKYNRLVFGQEYLSYFHRKIASGSGVKILFSGDSTVAGNGLLENYRIHNLIKNLATYDGFYNVSTVNRGQAGKTSSDWVTTYLSGDIAENADLNIFRWGINDPANGGDLSSFFSNTKSALQQLRANKDYTQQSIVLMMPNSTSDSAHGRGELWYESMVNGLKRLAREFKCVFIDTYASLQDSRNAFDYMDSTYNGASSMHPKEIMNIWIADLIYNVIYPRSLKLLFGQPEPKFVTAYDAESNPDGLRNGWSVPSGFRALGYWLENGKLKFMGVISGGTTTNGTVLFKTPFKIATATFLNVGTRGGGGTLLYEPDGTIKIETLIPPTSGTQWITFEDSGIKLNRNIVSLP